MRVANTLKGHLTYTLSWGLSMIAGTGDPFRFLIGDVRAFFAIVGLWFSFSAWSDHLILNLSWFHAGLNSGIEILVWLILLMVLPQIFIKPDAGTDKTVSHLESGHFQIDINTAHPRWVAGRSWVLVSTLSAWLWFLVVMATVIFPQGLSSLIQFLFVIGFIVGVGRGFSYYFRTDLVSGAFITGMCLIVVSILIHVVSVVCY